MKRRGARSGGSRAEGAVASQQDHGPPVMKKSKENKSSEVTRIILQLSHHGNKAGPKPNQEDNSAQQGQD